MGLLDSLFVRKVVMFLGPKVMPRRYFEVIYAGKKDPWFCETNPYETEKYERTDRAIQNGWTESVLELGCGEGVYTQMLAPRAKKILAVDVSESAVARGNAKALPGVEFRTLDVQHEPLPKGFSLIIAAEMLYFVGKGKEYDRVCDKILESLAPGGHLVLINNAKDAPRLTKPFLRKTDVVSNETFDHPARPYTISAHALR